MSVAVSRKGTTPMMISPCKKCLRGNDDKNNPACLACTERMNYVKQLERSIGGPLARTDYSDVVQLPFPRMMPSGRR
jgi:hypothetical protein